jgi:hypothetical protein
MLAAEALRLEAVRIEDDVTVWERLFLCKYFHFDTFDVRFNQAIYHNRDASKHVLLIKDCVSHGLPQLMSTRTHPLLIQTIHFSVFTVTTIDLRRNAMLCSVYACERLNTPNTSNHALLVNA